MNLFNTRVGLGTWQMGENPRHEADEVKALETAIQIGYELIDTAEMYASGYVEILIGKALNRVGGGIRSRIEIVSKVLPSNASTQGVIKACESSIQRMGCEYIDCYLLHWQGSYPYEATLEGFIALQERGLIRSYGVSNFDTKEMLNWIAAEKSIGGPYQTACNQVYYALNARGIEFDLIPLLKEKEITLMAYSPLEAGQLMHNSKLSRIAKQFDVTPAQLALAWVLRQTNTVAIPKTVKLEHLNENLSAQDMDLSPELLNELDTAFPPPNRKKTLMVI